MPVLDCSTIIVSYNTFELTREAVRTARDAAPGLAHEVIVVDNASPDRSAARLADAFADAPDVRVIASAENLGFAKANNVGAAAARGRVLFFLNPDTVVLGDAVRRLVAFLDAHPEVGAVGPRVYHGDGTDHPSAFAFPTATGLLRYYFPVLDALRGRDRREDPTPERSGYVGFVHGCALALRRDAFEAVGGWDERYFMYSEETELCWALREAGYRSYFLREAEIVHFGGVSSRERYAEQQVMTARSAATFLRRHRSPWLVGLNRVAGALGFAGRAAAFGALMRLRPDRAESYRPRREAASALWRWFLTDYS